jgi:hypothetical protein
MKSVENAFIGLPAEGRAPAPPTHRLGSYFITLKDHSASLIYTIFTSF